MKVIFLIFLIVNFLNSQELELDNLLSEYGSSEELHLKSKKESAGHVIVYSRADLDKMQAYSLNDILKTLRMYTLQTNSNGMTTLVKAGSDKMTYNPIKIYINKHELNAATLGNALTQYGKMSLYFIDHIEVYQSSNSVTFGNEPANTIIKLYTKNPSRENGISTQLSVDSRGGLNIRAIDARKDGKYSYLVNLDASKNNFETQTLNNKELSRDGVRGQFYFNFAKDDSYIVEVGATDETYDMFRGLGVSPLDNNVHTSSGYISASKYFDNDLSLTINIAHESLRLSSKDDLGINLFDNTVSYDVESTVSTKIYDIMLDKKIVLGSNDLSLGVQFKSKTFYIDEFTSDNVDQHLIESPKEKKIFVAYAEDLYSLNERNLITISGKINNTKNDYSSSVTNYILRAGYLSTIADSLALKVFAIKGYLSPTFRQTTFSPSYNINPDLESADTLTTTIEITYKKGDTILTFGGGSSKTKNGIVFDRTQLKYINNDDTSQLSRVYVNIEQDFNINNKLVVDFFKMYTKNNFSPTHGFLIKSFNKIGKIEVYNELVYRSSYTTIDGVYIEEGNNYSLGVIYPFSKKMELKLKGENLLDIATEVDVNGLDVPAIDRRAILTMEYTF